jgi:hypothetical protein
VHEVGPNMNGLDSVPTGGATSHIKDLQAISAVASRCTPSKNLLVPHASGVLKLPKRGCGVRHSLVDTRDKAARVSLLGENEKHGFESRPYFAAISCKSCLRTGRLPSS